MILQNPRLTLSQLSCSVHYKQNSIHLTKQIPSTTTIIQKNVYRTINYKSTTSIQYPKISYFTKDIYLHLCIKMGIKIFPSIHLSTLLQIQLVGLIKTGSSLRSISYTAIYKYIKHILYADLKNLKFFLLGEQVSKLRKTVTPRGECLHHLHQIKSFHHLSSRADKLTQSQIIGNCLKQICI